MVTYRRKSGASDVKVVQPEDLEKTRKDVTRRQHEALLAGDVDLEIVLFEAPSLEVLVRNHEHYFR